MGMWLIATSKFMMSDGRAWLVIESRHMGFPKIRIARFELFVAIVLIPGDVYECVAVQLYNWVVLRLLKRTECE